MSQLNHMHYSELGNVTKFQPAKKIGADHSQFVEKKALADVGNTLQHRSIHRASKPTVSIRTKGKNIFGVEKNTTISDKMKQENKKNAYVVIESDIDTMISEDKHVPPVCSCNISEDDFADTMLKDIRLKKEQIDILALNWENPPTLSAKDIRVLDVPQSITEPAVLNLSWPSFLDDLPKLDAPTAEVPPVFLDLSYGEDGFNCVDAI